MKTNSSRCAIDRDAVIFLYDANDRNFGYVLNFTCDWCSTWGYPFSDSDAKE